MKIRERCVEARMCFAGKGKSQEAEQCTMKTRRAKKVQYSVKTRYSLVYMQLEEAIQ